jgi:tRNA dimethylallyltransferase
MNSELSRLLVVLAGPTAVGKTSASIEIAKALSCEILSSDSRQFYREMMIGTARPSQEILNIIPHHFIAHLSIHDSYDVSRFETDALHLLERLFVNHRTALMVGGSGLYINAVCQGIDELPDPDDSLRRELKDLLKKEGIGALQQKVKQLDPVYYGQVDLANPNRLLRAVEVSFATGIPYSSLRKNKPKHRNFRIIKIGLQRDRDELNKRINDRVDDMMTGGLMNEVKGLFPFRSLNALNTVGYKELFDHLDGKFTVDQAVEKIKTNTRRFAKRQMTWFRKDQEIRWFHPDEVREIIEYINSFIIV